MFHRDALVRAAHRVAPTIPSDILNEIIRVVEPLIADNTRHDLMAVVAERFHQEHVAREETPCPLSDRECEVVRQLADGGTRAQAANDLFIETNTVKSHLSRMLQRVGALNTTHLVATALRRGWIT